MIRTDDNAPLHDKFQLAGLAAYGWWHAAISYSGRLMTDGFIRARAVAFVFPAATQDELGPILEALAREGAIHKVNAGERPACHHPSRYCPSAPVRFDGYILHDYFEFQKRSSEARRIRADKIRAGRKGGENSWKTRKQSAEPRTEATAEPHSVPIRSVPIRSVPEATTTALAESPEAATSAVVTLNGYLEPARAVLAFLNQRAGRAYRPVPATLKIIAARLKEGASIEDCKGVVARKCRKWASDPKMAEYLRPETLFNATKFNSYLGEQGT